MLAWPMTPCKPCSPPSEERHEARPRWTLEEAVKPAPTTCQCTHEAGDSACPVHPSCDCCGCPPERHSVDDEELRECLDCGCEQYEDAWKKHLELAESGRTRASRPPGDEGRNGA